MDWTAPATVLEAGVGGYVELSPSSGAETRVHHCADCQVEAPITDTNYTLISSRYGWRMTRVVTTDGRRAMQWRCPACWENYKQHREHSSRS